MNSLHQWIAVLTSAVLSIPAYSATVNAGKFPIKSVGTFGKKPTKTKPKSKPKPKPDQEGDACDISPSEEIPAELAANCPIPTLEECQEEGYYTGRCGLLQANNSWTCATLSEHAYSCQEAQWEHGSSVYASSMVVEGIVQHVARLPLETEEERAPHYIPDLESLQSQEAAATFSESAAEQSTASQIDVNYVATTILSSGIESTQDIDYTPVDNFSFDIHAHYAGNGSNFASCYEYVYEKYYDINEYWRVVSHNRNNYRYAYRKAFTPAGGSYAIGTNHLTGSSFKDFAGNTSTSSIKTEKRNRFFDLPNRPLLGIQNSRNTFAIAQDRPGIRDAMEEYSAASAAIVYKVAHNSSTINKTMGWHKQMSETISVEGKKAPGLASPDSAPPPTDTSGNFQAAGPTPHTTSTNGNYTIESALPPYQVPSPEALAITGRIPENMSNGKELRRYFDEELNELDRLQDQKDALLLQWRQLASRFPNSGWTIQDLLAEMPQEEEEIGQMFVTTAGSTANQGSGLGTFSSGEEPDPDPPAPEWQPGGYMQEIPILSEENAARKRVLDGLVSVYGKANQHGCLESGLTVCDWSPRAFALRGVGRLDEERQESYEYCLGLMPPPFTDNLGEERPYITPPDGMTKEGVPYPRCVVEVESTMTPTHLDQIQNEQVDCISKLPQYEIDLAAHETAVEREMAEARLVLAGLYDPETKEKKRPSQLKGRSETKGNKYFGLEYSYEYGFDTTMSEGLCGFRFRTGGEFIAATTVLTHRNELIDTAAWLDSTEGRADAHISILGVELFDGLQLTPTTSSDEAMAFNFVRDSGESYNQTMAGFRVWAGPVPIKISGGFSGSTSVDLGFSGTLSRVESCPDASIRAHVEPQMSVAGFIEAGVDLGVIAAGIRGELTLIDIGLAADVGIELGATDPIEGSLADLNLLFSVDTSATVRLETLSGRIALYGSIGPCPFCKRGEKALVDWDGLRWDKVLFDLQYDVYLGDYFVAGTEDDE